MSWSCGKVELHPIVLKNYKGEDITTFIVSGDSIREHQLFLINEKLDKLISILDKKGECT